jgi:transposase-like protein
MVYRPKKWTQEHDKILAAHLEDKTKTYPQIAREMGFSVKTIEERAAGKRIGNYGLIYDKGRKGIEAIKKVYHPDKPISQIAKEAGQHPRSVRRWLSRHGKLIKGE